MAGRERLLNDLRGYRKRAACLFDPTDHGTGHLRGPVSGREPFECRTPASELLCYEAHGFEPVLRCIPVGWSDHPKRRPGASRKDLMGDLKGNAFIALYLGLTAVVTLGWVGVIGYGAWHFLFG